MKHSDSGPLMARVLEGFAKVTQSIRTSSHCRSVSVKPRSSLLEKIERYYSEIVDKSMYMSYLVRHSKLSNNLQQI